MRFFVFGKGVGDRRKKGALRGVNGCILLLVLLVSGCASRGLDASPAQAPLPDQAQIAIYLEADGNCSNDVSLRLSEFVLHDDLQETPLYWDPIAVTAGEVQGAQLLLGLANLPAGRYARLDMTLNTISADGLEGPGQAVSLRLSPAVHLDAGDRACLFVNWRLDECLAATISLASKFSARGQELPLARDLLYALCGELQSLYLVRTDTDRVAASIGLEGEVVEMAIDTQRQRLYLLDRARRSLQVLDLATYRLIDRLPLPLTLAPSHLALDVAGNAAFVSDASARRVVRLDLDSGQMTAQQDVGLKPGRLFFVDRDRPLLAVVAPYTQSVFLLDAETLAVTRTLETGLRPQDVTVAGDRLFVSEAGSQVISVHDLSGGQKLDQVRMNLPQELFYYAPDDTIYVGSSQPAGARAFRADRVSGLRRLPLREATGAFAAASRRGRLYVTAPSARQLIVFDQVAERVVGIIMLGGRADDLIAYE